MPVDVHVVSHTHWDREWYLTREQYRLRLVGLIDRVLERLESDPRFVHFHLDGQTVVLEDYLEVRPEQEQRLRRHVEAGRLLVGPWYVMPDMHLVSGESLVRNLALGHRIAESFGGVMRAGYMPDPFGHVAQMPQILAGFGLDSAILWRGFAGERAEYWWRGPDGTRVLLLHLPREGYCNALRLPLLGADAMREAGAALVSREAARSSTGVVLLMAGVDHVEPHPAIVEIPARLAEAGLPARISTLPGYVAAVRAGVAAAESSGGAPALETIAGELRAGEDYAFLLPGVLSARTYLKQANTRVETLLERVAEPLAAFAWLAGERYPDGPLQYAWKTLLQNHPHDSICGCSVDAVHEENESRFARAEQAGGALASDALRALARRVPGRGLGVLIVNTTPRSAAGVLVGEVELPVGVIDPGHAHDAALLEAPLAFLPAGATVGVRGAAGVPLPFQVLASDEGTAHAMSRYLPPLAVRTRRLRLAIWHPGLPGCGYTSIEIRGEAAGAAPLPPGVEPARAGERAIENGLVRLEVRTDGSVDLTDLRNGRRLVGCLALEDVADVGDEYDFSPAPRDRRVTNAEARRVVVRRRAEGPLRASLEVALELPLALNATRDRRGRVAKTVLQPVLMELSLDAGSARVLVQLLVENRARDHRLRVLFPTGVRHPERSGADSAFAIVERPARRAAAPMRSCVAAGDARSGIMVLAEGLHEYELVDAPSGGAIAVTLLRCVGALSRDDLATRRGHAGPGLPTPGAQCLGPHRFRLAVEPRTAPPSASELLEASAWFLAPPRWVAPTGPAPASPTEASSLAAEGCFLRLASEPSGAAVLSALKRADEREGLVVRVFNAEGIPARVTVAPLRPVVDAFQLDLRERRRERLAVSSGAVELTLRPAGIETIELLLSDNHT